MPERILERAHDPAVLNHHLRSTDEAKARQAHSMAGGHREYRGAVEGCPERNDGPDVTERTQDMWPDVRPRRSIVEVGGRQSVDVRETDATFGADQRAVGGNFVAEFEASDTDGTDSNGCARGGLDVECCEAIQISQGVFSLYWRRSAAGSGF